MDFTNTVEGIFSQNEEDQMKELYILTRQLNDIGKNTIVMTSKSLCIEYIYPIIRGRG